MSETKPWVAHGTIVAFDGGGFDVRRCPDPEQLASFIVEAVNGHAALTSLMEENERLKRELADADALIKAQQHDFAANNIRNAEDAARAQAAEQKLAEAARLLEPFADLGDYVLSEAPQEATYWYAGPSCTGERMAQISLEYFRAARRFIKEAGNE